MAPAARVSSHRILLGRADGAEWGYKNSMKIYAEVELSDQGVGSGPWQTVDHDYVTETPLRFSITFDVETSGGRVVECGAMGEKGLDIVTIKDAEPKVFEALRRLIPWHLNDMNAACSHQEIVWEASDYGRRPSLELTEPCERSGYRYGSAWLIKPLTPEVIIDCATVGLQVPQEVV